MCIFGRHLVDRGAMMGPRGARKGGRKGCMRGGGEEKRWKESATGERGYRV